MTKVKHKAAAVTAPRDAAEANVFLSRMGHLDRRLLAIKSEADELIGVARAVAETASQPLVEEHQALAKGLDLWASANRAALTGDGRTKTVRLAAGTLSWRLLPPSVKLRDVKAVIEELKARHLGFLRTKHEVDKEAMLAAPDVASLIPGVTISSEGEEFVIEPATIGELTRAGAA